MDKEDNKEIKYTKDTNEDGIKAHKYFRLELKGDSHKYISLMSEQTNQSMTMYINQLIDEDKKKNTELYKHLIEMQKKIEELKRM